MSDLADKIAGVHLPDQPEPQAPVLAWLRRETRQGSLAPFVAKFAAAQPESLDPGRVLVVSLGVDTILCRIPFCLQDHESPTPSPSEVCFLLDPLSGDARRV